MFDREYLCCAAPQRRAIPPFDQRGNLILGGASTSVENAVPAGPIGGPLSGKEVVHAG